MAFRVTIIMTDDGTPEANQLRGFQLEVLCNFSALDFPDNTMCEAYLVLDGAIATIEDTVCLIQRHHCQRMSR